MNPIERLSAAPRYADADHRDDLSRTGLSAPTATRYPEENKPVNDGLDHAVKKALLPHIAHLTQENIRNGRPLDRAANLATKAADAMRHAKCYRANDSCRNEPPRFMESGRGFRTYADVGKNIIAGARQ